MRLPARLRLPILAACLLPATPGRSVNALLSNPRASVARGREVGRRIRFASEVSFDNVEIAVTERI